MTTRFVVDTSAFAHVPRFPAVKAIVDGLASDERVAVSPTLALELGHSARNAAEHERLGAALTKLPLLAVLPLDWERAFEVQGILAARGKHRSASMPDLVTAAVAERSGRAVLHYDKDFDLIAGVTGQSTTWVVPKGSL